jgi:hypothetical protein
VAKVTSIPAMVARVIGITRFHFCPSGKSVPIYGIRMSSLKFMKIKNISLFQKLKSWYIPAHPVPLRGAYHDRSRTWGGLRWTLVVPIANGMRAYGKDVWS